MSIYNCMIRVWRRSAAGRSGQRDPSPEGVGLISVDEDDSRVKVLLVVAHPDDESECAAVVYRITHELDGIVDQVVVTNGEGGDKYAAAA